jgi:NADH-quinone oxidoreductase subunit M
MVAFLVLETLMVGTFGALDLVVFYLFFEGGLIPMFGSSGMWRAWSMPVSFPLHAARLSADAARDHGDTAQAPPKYAAAPRLRAACRPGYGFFASFAVKLPMWPVHTLPDAHVEVPTAGSVICR